MKDLKFKNSFYGKGCYYGLCKIHSEKIDTDSCYNLSGFVVGVFSLRLNPTSPLTVIIGNKQSTPELQQQYTEQFDLDEPLLKQYIIWLKGIAHGDLGIDYVQKQPILNQIIDRIPITIGLVLFSTILGTVIAILIGVLAAMKRGTWIDSALSTLMLVISSIPTFVLSILAILFLSKYVPGYSFIGTYSNTAEFISRISVRVS